MLFTKYMIAIAMCLSQLMHGAASSVHHEDIDGSSHSSEERRLLLPDKSVDLELSLNREIRISSWFSLDTFTVPDDGKFYMPVVNGSVGNPPKMEKLLFPEKYSFRATKFFQGFAGFVTGADQKGVQELAHAVAEVECRAQENGFKGRLSEALATIGISNIGLLERAKNCELEGEVRSLCNNQRHFRQGIGHAVPKKIMIPAAYKDLLERAKCYTSYENLAGLAASIKVLAQERCVMSQEKNPEVKFIAVPMLIEQHDIQVIKQQIFGDDAK